MKTFGIILIVLLLITMVINVIFPRQIWWFFAKLSYRNPDAHEPTDFAFTGQRIGFAIMALAMGFVLWMILTAD